MHLDAKLLLAKVCFNFLPAFCSWLVTHGRFGCRNDLSCFSFSFQHRIRQASGNTGHPLNPTSFP